MSAFMNMQAQKLFAEGSVQPTSKQSSARSTPSHSMTAAPARPASAAKSDSARKRQGSTSSTPATTPPLRPQSHGSPAPASAQPPPKSSPRVLQPEVKRPSLAPVVVVDASHAAHSRSPSASSSDSSDEDFVYILDSVKTAEEAVERIRAVQQPKERSLTAFLNGLPGSTSNLADLADTAAGQGSGSAGRRKMKGGLPATMEEFYECPRYTVSLTAAREAVFSDALSGFHSYVEREKAQREKLRALQHHQHHQHQHSAGGSSSNNTNINNNSNAPQSQGAQATGLRSNNTHHHNAGLISFSSGATEEWNAALAAAAPQPSTAAADKAHASPAAAAAAATARASAGAAAIDRASAHAEPPSALPTFAAPEAKDGEASPNVSSEAPSTPVKSSGNGSLCLALPPALTAATASSSSHPSTDDTPGAAADTQSAKEKEQAASQHLSASYMFIMRSRDTEAMSPVSSPRLNPSSADFGKLSFRGEDKPRLSAMAVLEDAAPTSGAPQHKGPVEAAGAAASPSMLPPSSVATGAAAATPSPGNLPPPPPLSTGEFAAAAKLTSPATAAPDPAQAAKLEEMQLQTLLQERIYQRARVPVVFRCRYSLEFAETTEEHKQRVQMRDRVMRHNERLAGPGGLTHAMRQRIRERYADPNTVALEWPYVWEQFERDIPRETLFIEDVPHHDADDALAAIMSYVEYCYDRGQQNIKERSEKLLAAASKESDAAAKATADTAEGAERAASPPPPPKTKNFFESLFSASSAAIKGAVATVRSSLPDFVGDPLLSVSGLDPALYHASLLFPTDPKARSEKIFTAVREVVLASQQSFMGFPYQLLCEQVGTERLGLALEALENDPDEEEEEEDAEEDSAAAAAAAAAAAPAPDTAKKPQDGDSEPTTAAAEPKSASLDVSAPIPIRRADDSDAEMKRESSSASFRASMPNSRVVRIYQSFSSPTLVVDNSASRRRRGHTAHAIDEWNVSSSSSHASDVVCSPCSPDAAATTLPATAAAPGEGANNVAAPASTAAVAVPRQPVRAGTTPDEKGGRAKTPLEAGRPPPLHSLTPDEPGAASPAPPLHAQPPHKSAKDAAARRRRRERRRRRRGQLPLLVGEPRPYEFSVFLDLVRARVAAKAAKEERKARQQRQRERVRRLVERQREHWHSAPNSNTASRCTSSASLDGMAKGQSDGASATPSPAPAKTKSSLFREDVEGSAYLLPTQPAGPPSSATAVPTSPLSASAARAAMPPETRGMRICLYFDAARNVPVVVVNKLFRLFTMPGVRGLTSSSSTSEGEGEGEPDDDIVLDEHEVAASQTRTIDVKGQDRAAGKVRKVKNSEKSLLLLIQVQFSLFTKEEAEVRWKWWKV